MKFSGRDGDRQRDENLDEFHEMNDEIWSDDNPEMVLNRLRGISYTVEQTIDGLYGRSDPFEEEYRAFADGFRRG